MQQPKEQSIRQKLGLILGIGASKGTATPQKTIEDLDQLEHSTFFTDDILRVCYTINNMMLIECLRALW
jgi:hypothetical protein